VEAAANKTSVRVVRRAGLGAGLGRPSAQVYRVFVEEYCIGGSFLIVGALGDYLPQ